MTRPLALNVAAWRSCLNGLLLACCLSGAALASPSDADPLPHGTHPAAAQVSGLPASPSGQPESTQSAAMSLIQQGLDYLGVPYRFGGTSPEKGFDCSGFVGSVFRNALGLDLPRSARDMAREGERVSMTELKPGDLVFFNTMRRAFSHVGIYLGDNRFVHAPSRGGGVRIEDMRDRYWSARFNGARRMLDE